MDIAEKRKPQDGKCQMRVGNKAIDFRISVLPVVWGEKTVMRVLDSSNLALDIKSLGFEDRSMQDYLWACAQPYGMILVTGPTGSGKSTTLYSAVRHIASPDINLVTVEDPVEYTLEGINQVPVNPKGGLTFAAALRSILRQDPDVVLLGEIRDHETLEIAVKAALTGHLVLSTLHTNDAPSTITRMVDMGMDPFMVASSTQLIAAQRLGRKLCPHCKKKVDLPKDALLRLGFLEEDLTQPMELFGPVGCPRCNGGYKGRFAILETMRMTEPIRRMVVERAHLADIKRQALSEGMLTLRRCGLLNASRGKTSLEEVEAVTMAD
jgi:type IV pilus assembly protein PilB